MSYDMDANLVEVAVALIMLILTSMKRDEMVSKLRCSMFGEHAAEGAGHVDVQLREVA